MSSRAERRMVENAAGRMVTRPERQAGLDRGHIHKVDISLRTQGKWESGRTWSLICYSVIIRSMRALEPNNRPIGQHEKPAFLSSRASSR